jgi:hypothetical protein
MRLPPVLACSILALACRSPSPEAAPAPTVELAPPVASAPAAAAPSASIVAMATISSPPPPAGVDAGNRPTVRLRWRVTDRRETTDRSGMPRATVALELLVDGGAPSRVALGRRAAWGFHADAVEDGGVASVSSYVDAHGEYADVTRPRRGELRVQCYGQDEVLPGSTPPRTNVRVAIVRIAPEATVVVDETVEDAAPSP